MPDQRLVEIYRARDNIHAHLIRSALDDAGIRAEITGESLQGALGEIPFGWPTAPRILVAEADAPRAREIIDRLEDSAPPA